MTKSEHIPEIRIVKLDEKDAANQMIVTTVWALECSYEFFSYDGTSLQLLGKLESDYCLYEPELREGRSCTATVGRVLGQQASLQMGGNAETLAASGTTIL